jgi:hypothetical protein
MDEVDNIMSWFPDTLNDEAAYAIQLFLESFKMAFEEQYYGQIRRHIESVTQDYQMELQLSLNAQDPDDKIPF